MYVILDTILLQPSISQDESELTINMRGFDFLHFLICTFGEVANVF